jgi:hypothetical protein
MAKKKTRTKKQKAGKAQSNKRRAKKIRARESSENAAGTSRATPPRIQLPPPDSEIQ